MPNTGKIQDHYLPASIRSSGTFYPYDAWMEYSNAINRRYIPSEVIPGTTKRADPIRGLFQGLVIGSILPCVIRPFDNLQVIVSTSPTKLTWDATISIIKDKPYKGIGTRIITNT